MSWEANALSGLGPGGRVHPWAPARPLPLDRACMGAALVTAAPLGLAASVVGHPESFFRD